MMLDIVIVNWNTGVQLDACLESIALANRADLHLNRVVIVDNASSDRSLENLGKSTLSLHLTCNSENQGFARACNQGAAGSTADFLLFLNPDTVLTLDSLCRPLAFMAQPENANVGIIGIQLLDGHGRVSSSCSRFPTTGCVLAEIFGIDRLYPSAAQRMDDWNHADSRAVDQVMGAFFLIRRDLFESLGGFDERFFVYFEEVDLSFRARSFGYSSYYLSDCRAIHKGGGSSEQVKAKRLFYSLRSRILYSYKHFGFFPATLVLLATLLIEPFTRLFLAAARGSIQGIAATVEAYWFLMKAACSGFSREVAE
jgi:N-acetylglucosaminyl-diphospho-decaprenol L-rhamnosyltransferase